MPAVSLSIYHGDTIVAFRIEDDEATAAAAIAALQPRYFRAPFRVVGCLLPVDADTRED